MFFGSTFNRSIKFNSVSKNKITIKVHDDKFSKIKNLRTFWNIPVFGQKKEPTEITPTKHIEVPEDVKDLVEKIKVFNKDKSKKEILSEIKSIIINESRGVSRVGKALGISLSQKEFNHSINEEFLSFWNPLNCWKSVEQLRLHEGSGRKEEKKKKKGGIEAKEWETEGPLGSHIIREMIPWIGAKSCFDIIASISPTFSKDPELLDSFYGHLPFQSHPLASQLSSNEISRAQQSFVDLNALTTPIISDATPRPQTQNLRINVQPLPNRRVYSEFIFHPHTLGRLLGSTLYTSDSDEVLTIATRLISGLIDFNIIPITYSLTQGPWCCWSDNRDITDLYFATKILANILPYFTFDEDELGALCKRIFWELRISAKSSWEVPFTPEDQIELVCSLMTEVSKATNFKRLGFINSAVHQMHSWSKEEKKIIRKRFSELTPPGPFTRVKQYIEKLSS